MVIEHLKCGWFELRCAISIKYALNYENTKDVKISQ